MEKRLLVIWKLSFSVFVLFIFIWSGCSDSVAVKEPYILRCPDVPVIHSGEATFYNPAGSSGSCMFDSTADSVMIGAINQFDYAGSEMCGACVRVTGPRGTVDIRIVDLCPECPQGNIDLSPQAFSIIADTTLGRVAITWQLIPCKTSDPVSYHFNDSTSQWWSAVQIRNHRYPVFSLEYFTSQKIFKRVNRTAYNYFVEPEGMGTGPYTFRIMDIYGHTLVDSGITSSPGKDVEGQKQFPLCNLHIGK